MKMIEFENLPMDRKSLAEAISETPLDMRMDYVNEMSTMKGHLEKCIQIISASNDCAEALLELVSEEVFHHIQSVVENLNAPDVLSKIDALIASSFGKKKLNVPLANQEKLNEFCNRVGKLNEIGKLRNAINIYFQCRKDFDDILQALLYFYGKKEDMKALRRYLKYFSDEKLDSMIYLAINAEKLN